MREEPKTTLADGSPVTLDHREINPATGQQKGYVVLSQEERDKGFTRPLRCSYQHVGVKPKNPLRDLTEEEHQQYDKFGYIAFEAYPENESPVTGRFWTNEALKNGCGAITTMANSIAETYARDPKFYGGTFCASCQKHFPLEQFVWIGTNETVGS